MLGMKVGYKFSDAEALAKFQAMATMLYDSSLVTVSYDVDVYKRTAELKYKLLKAKSNNDDEIKPLLIITALMHVFSRYEVIHEDID